MISNTVQNVNKLRYPEGSKYRISGSKLLKYHKNILPNSIPQNPNVDLSTIAQIRFIRKLGCLGGMFSL